jgi:hypothetical protein
VEPLARSADGGWRADPIASAAFPGLDSLEPVAVAGYTAGGVGESGVWTVDPRWDELSPADADVDLMV